MLNRINGYFFERLSVFHVGELDFFCFCRIHFQESVKLHNLTGRAEAVCRSIFRFRVDIDACRIEYRFRHLARHESPPDKVIEAKLISLKILLDNLGVAPWVRRTDRFVRFLRAF